FQTFHDDLTKRSELQRNKETKKEFPLKDAINNKEKDKINSNKRIDNRIKTKTNRKQIKKG
ncbi:MAG: hypothetical protein MJ252_04765, partial [archaeon]|nr:hypothetical protein [archaeon]